MKAQGNEQAGSKMMTKAKTMLGDSAGKNSGSGQILVGLFGQCQNSDEKLMSDTRFFWVGQFGRE